MRRAKREQVTIIVEVVEPVIMRRKVLRRVVLSPYLACANIKDLAGLAHDLGLQIGFGMSPIENPIPRNGTCLL